MLISGFTSSGKQAFSILNLILNGHRMKLKHSLIEMLIWVKGNDFNWSKAEHDNIINNTADIYMECCKTKQDKYAFKEKK